MNMLMQSIALLSYRPATVVLIIHIYLFQFVYIVIRSKHMQYNVQPSIINMGCSVLFGIKNTMIQLIHGFFLKPAINVRKNIVVNFLTH